MRQACLLIWWRRQCATGLATYMTAEAVCDRPSNLCGGGGSVDRPAYLCDGGGSVRQAFLLI